MCRLRNIAMRDYQESVTTRQKEARQSDPYVPLCFAGDTKSKSCYPYYIRLSYYSFAELQTSSNYAFSNFHENLREFEGPMQYELSVFYCTLIQIKYLPCTVFYLPVNNFKLITSR